MLTLKNRTGRCWLSTTSKATHHHESCRLRPSRAPLFLPSRKWWNWQNVPVQHDPDFIGDKRRSGRGGCFNRHRRLAAAERQDGSLCVQAAVEPGSRQHVLDQRSLKQGPFLAYSQVDHVGRNSDDQLPCPERRPQFALLQDLRRDTRPFGGVCLVGGDIKQLFPIASDRVRQVELCFTNYCAWDHFEVIVIFIFSIYISILYFQL